MANTQSDSQYQATSRAPVPGVLVVFSHHEPLHVPVALPTGASLVLGREGIGGLRLPDPKMSERHAEVAWRAGAFEVRDLGSSNGTGLDGAALARGELRRCAGGLLRLGRTLALLVADLRASLLGEVSTDGEYVVGPTLRRALDRAAAARHEGRHLLVHGESGAGKELVARRYHQAGHPAGPLVILNCAHLQHGLAERQLFGSVKGVATDARHADGFFHAADGGVLFLDEVADLELDVQPKLLRALETGEVARLGESRAEHVEVKVVAASHQRLRDRVADGRFREDLYMRLKQVELDLPPLRARPEEVPFLMRRAVEAMGVGLHATAVEAALLRDWSGNIRDLLDATRAAARIAREKGEDQVRGEHFQAPPSPAVTTTPAGRRPSPVPRLPPEHGREAVVEALRACHQNKTRAAELLGLHRTQLYRLMKTLGLLESSAPDEEPPKP